MKRTVTTISLAVFVSSLFAIGVAFKGPAGGRGSIVPSVQAKDKDKDDGDVAQNSASQGPEGSWLYTVTIPNPPGAPIVFLGTETYSAGGGYVEADQLSFTPGSLATAGHGAWKSTGERRFLLTYVNLTYDATGTPTGSSKVRQTTKLARTGNSYSGSGDYAYYDLNGNVVLSGTFTITANRILVESPE